MDLENIRELIKLSKDEGLAGLKVKSKELEVSIQLPVAGVAAVQTVAAPAVTNTGAPTSSSAAKTEEGVVAVTSPFVGTYYGASAPEAPPFVSVGDKVRKGQVLCILEAMKIMNEIEADIAGEIVEICVENESLVEYGQVLFKIKKA